MKIGIMNKSTNITEYTYTYHRYKTIGDYPENDYLQYEILEGTSAEAYSCSGDQAIFATGYVPYDVEGNFVKIYDYVPDTSNYKISRPPKGLDYVTGLATKLYPKRVFNKGELNNVKWYSDEELTDLVLNVDIVYTRDGARFPIERTTTRTWYKQNGEPHPDVKVTRKIYDHDFLAKISEGIRRRGNLVNSIQIPVLSFMYETIPLEEGESSGSFQVRVIMMGRAFLDSLQEEFSNFVSNSSTITDSQDPNYGKKSIVVAIENKATTDSLWLMNKPLQLDPSGNTTILAYLIDSFTY